MKYLLLVFILLGLMSCSSKTDEEETDELVSSANHLLSANKCQDAIDMLEGHGRRMDHFSYVSTLSSAYACRAGFNEPTFYGTDLAKIASGGDAFLGSLALFSTSPTSTLSEAGMVDLFTAIEVILAAGNYSESSSNNRIEFFGSDDGNDLNVQLLYMLMAMLGKYTYYYGDANATTGVKGDRTALGSNCYTTYTSDSATAVIALGGGGSCVAGQVGHSQMVLGVGRELWAERMCQGVVLLNNVLDVFSSVIISTGSSFGDLEDAITNFDFTAQCNTYLSSSDICSVKDLSICKRDYSGEPTSTAEFAGTNILEIYFAAIMETFHQ